MPGCSSARTRSSLAASRRRTAPSSERCSGFRASTSAGVGSSSGFRPRSWPSTRRGRTTCTSCTSCARTCGCSWRRCGGGESPARPSARSPGGVSRTWSCRAGASSASTSRIMRGRSWRARVEGGGDAAAASAGRGRLLPEGDAPAAGVDRGGRRRGDLQRERVHLAGTRGLGAAIAPQRAGVLRLGGARSRRRGGGGREIRRLRVPRAPARVRPRRRPALAGARRRGRDRLRGVRAPRLRRGEPVGAERLRVLAALLPRRGARVRREPTLPPLRAGGRLRRGGADQRRRLRARALPPARSAPARPAPAGRHRGRGKPTTPHATARR